MRHSRVNNYMPFMRARKAGYVGDIHVSTDTNGKVMNIIFILNNDVHDANKPVIEGSSMWNSNFQLFYNKGCSHKECLLK